MVPICKQAIKIAAMEDGATILARIGVGGGAVFHGGDFAEA
jgi:hypothetical protein